MADENVKDITVLIDNEVLDELKSIMEDDFGELLQVFLEESVTLMSDIHAGFEEESEDLSRSVHTLKSCSRNVGAMQLGRIAEVMEERIINKEIDSAKSQLENLQEVFTKSHAEIKKFMQDNMDEVA
jgi:HPt (histidine-containing phosphotransfer) domain-containing protein